MSVLDAVRRPEYTGENRCWPCTAANFVAVALCAILAGVAWPPAVVVVGVGGVAAVTVRGYVLPYTPRYAPRLAAALPVAFGPIPGSDDRPRAPGDLGGEADGGERVIAALFEAGVLAETDDELRLADSVRTAWDGEIVRLRDADDEALCAVLADAAPFPATASVERRGVTVTAVETACAAGGNEYETGSERQRRASVWLPRALAIADAATVHALRGVGVDSDTATRAATPFRLFLESCPLCGSRVVETTTSACCGGPGGLYANPETDVLACTDCDEVLYEFDD